MQHLLSTTAGQSYAYSEVRLTLTPDICLLDTLQPAGLLHIVKLHGTRCFLGCK